MDIYCPAAQQTCVRDGVNKTWLECLFKPFTVSPGVIITDAFWDARCKASSLFECAMDLNLKNTKTTTASWYRIRSIICISFRLFRFYTSYLPFRIRKPSFFEFKKKKKKVVKCYDVYYVASRLIFMGQQNEVRPYWMAYCFCNFC